MFGDGESVKVAPDGRILDGNPVIVDRGFRYILEKPTGAIEILTRRQFHNRTGKVATMKDR
ncbi:hypothetical protein [Symmachiella macrocystis]|uniref:hypothetical protein n=1 Tax=Symmachiella macrocystis TaxID=2527985 RepID=UPI0011B77466|nr:hypothetical protein [Symmachiella macrocystis]